MNKLRIAYVHATYAYYIAYQHLREELAKVVNVRFYTLPRPWEENDKPLWDAKDIVRDFDPDAIIIGVNNTVHRSISNMENVDCLKIMMSDDPHNWLERQAKFMNNAKIDIMLMMNYGKWYGKPENYPIWWKEPFVLASERPKEIYGGMIPIADKYQRRLSYPCKFINFPESVNMEFFKDRGYERTCDVFNSGSHSSLVYPFREKIHATLKNHSRIKCCIQPFFAYTWEEYAQMLAKSKMLVEGGTVFGYTSQRFTQAMASKTLVVAPIPYDNIDNCFIPDENFIEINEGNFIDKILYYIEHEDERKRIIEHAYQTILKYHTCKIRANELINIIKENLK